jgi:SPP1 gp7 family putative phage head morphogenesis protein
MPSELENALNQYRARLLRNERAAASDMVRVYGAAWQQLRALLRQAQNEIEAGDTSNAHIEQWAQQLQAEVEQQLRRFAPYAEDSVIASQRMAVDAALDSVGVTIEAAGGPQARLTRLNPRAVESIVGYASDGSPLRTLFDSLAPERGQEVATVFQRAVAIGQNPNITAEQVRAAFGTGLTQALTISRTETMRAWRTATHENYEANDDILSGWVWTSALSARTCASCFAMHGSVHRLNERLDEHPNGRCIAGPVVRGVGSRVTQTGEERFATLDEATQRKILGAGRYAAWVDGRIALTPTGENSIVGRMRSRQWGTTRYARPLSAFVQTE